MKEQNEANQNLNVNEQNVNVNEKEQTMKEQNEILNVNEQNVNEAMSAEETQEWLYAIGSAEEEAAFMARDFALYLEKQGVCEEKQLKEWAVGQLLWEKDWPGPRTIWQSVTKGTLENKGKKTYWKVYWKKNDNDVPVRMFRIEWGSEFSLYQEVELSLIAGLGKVAGVLASRKKRAGNSTVPGSESSTNSTTSSTTSSTNSSTSSTTSSTATEVEKLKQENASLYKEVEDLRAEQVLAYDKAKSEFSSLLEESAKREKSANDTAKKVKEQATGMDEAILKALTTLNEAKGSYTKEKLLAIIEAAKAALAEAPKLETGELETKK